MLSKTTEAAQRLQTLKKLLQTGAASTQDELVSELKRQKFHVTQSTISRDLSRLNAVKAREGGRIVYRLPEDAPAIATAAALPNHSNLVLDIRQNESLVIVITTPGSAPLVARLLDQSRFTDILGTLAGDDAIFVAPKSIRYVGRLAEKIRAELLP